MTIPSPNATISERTRTPSAVGWSLSEHTAPAAHRFHWVAIATAKPNRSEQRTQPPPINMARSVRPTA